MQTHVCTTQIHVHRHDQITIDYIDLLGQVLMEAKQVLPSGVERSRGLPLSEKLHAGEDWYGAVGRAVREELGSVLGPGDCEVRKHEEGAMEAWLAVMGR